MDALLRVLDDIADVGEFLFPEIQGDLIGCKWLFDKSPSSTVLRGALRETATRLRSLELTAEGRSRFARLYRLYRTALIESEKKFLADLTDALPQKGGVQ